VKQLEYRELAVRCNQRPQRHRKVERIAADIAELLLEDGAGEKRPE
jgi:hypothetical protein